MKESMVSIMLSVEQEDLRTRSMVAANVIAKVTRTVQESVKEGSSIYEIPEGADLESEFYIVSEFFAKVLEEFEERVMTDLDGNRIWIRTCIGQAIYMDEVVKKIAAKYYSEN